MSDEIKIIDKATFDNVIKDNTRGLFLYNDEEKHVYIGIDNSVGKCWIEEKESKEECIAWLMDEEEGKYDKLNAGIYGIRRASDGPVPSKMIKGILKCFDEMF
ncbi:hypothetical protein [Clostridioides sp. ZZV14-6105]|uniref:hypothetical protein n=1 Tax=Clostridioides sp. ZZV14-6105 TaxID=2811492 RepID=UPI001D0FFF79|nr:hypothetical protein [Clostridioides sp. ZZV14-6105]